LIIGRDRGASWTTVPSVGYGVWGGASTSNDGTYLVAGQWADGGGSFGSGSLFQSYDSGGTWAVVSQVGKGWWRSMASSFDGSSAIAVRYGGANYIFTTNDTGLNWYQQSVPRGSWTSAAISDNGAVLVATQDYNITGRQGLPWASVDSGSNWYPLSQLGYANWASVAISADGKNWIIAQHLRDPSNPGYIYTSSDTGGNFIRRTQVSSVTTTTVISTSTSAPASTDILLSIAIATATLWIFLINC